MNKAKVIEAGIKAWHGAPPEYALRMQAAIVAALREICIEMIASRVPSRVGLGVKIKKVADELEQQP